MGFGTIFTTDIYLNRQIFNSRYELDDRVKELESDIEKIKSKISAMVTSRPKDIINEKDNDGYMINPIDEVLRMTTELFEWLEEIYSELNKLYLFQQYLDENPDVDISKLNDVG